jgi:hypothetical protein
VEQQYAEIEKEKLHGFSSTGVPTKQESKLGILEYTYTPAMPSTERERERERPFSFWDANPVVSV